MLEVLPLTKLVGDATSKVVLVQDVFDGDDEVLLAIKEPDDVIMTALVALEMPERKEAVLFAELAGEADGVE